MTPKQERALVTRGVRALARLAGGDGELIAPAVSVYETREAFVLAADMPGAEKGSIQVRAESGLLSISAQVIGEHRGETQNGGRQYARQFVLTEGIDCGNSTAEFKDGVLIVTLPKTVESQGREIVIRGD